ncbi:hypothetical protein [Streptomyces davaonensis]|uniref:hypothetical protein n=1 Tax=Streptomyces davaonensis TaxID=348043 RepID=UPI0012FF7023|nr:hypothetical protein [Streptomyces davaonensis]
MDDTLVRIRDAFRAAGFPTVCSTDIDGWLKTHAAYMAPIIAMGCLPPRPARRPGLKFKDAMDLAAAVGEGFAAVRHSGTRLSPLNMRTLDRMPQELRALLLWSAFCTPMARHSLASHSGAAPGEVAALLNELQALGRSVGLPVHSLERLATRVPEALGR